MRRKSPEDQGRASSFWKQMRFGAKRKLQYVTTELTAETAPAEPIDFSAPSVPYYDDLAARFSLARIVLFMILLVFTVVTIISNRHLITYSNLYYMVRDINAATVTAQSQSAYLSYPISSVTPDVAVYRGGLVVAGSNELTVLSGSGKRTLSEGVTYGHPCVRANDKYFLTFGRGETGFAVYNAFGRMYHENTDYPIYDACMGVDGSFAIVTRSRDYTSEVILYNDDMKPRASVRLGGYVTAVTTNPVGDVTAILSVDSENGTYATKLTLVRVGDRITTKEHTWDGTFAGQAAFLSDDRLAVVCRDRLMVTDTNGDIRGESAFENQAPALCATGSQVALLFRDAAGLGRAVLRVYDRDGSEAYAVTLPSVMGMQEMVWSGGDLYLRATDELIRITDKGQSITAAEVGRTVIRMLDGGEDMPLVCAPAHAYYPNIADFQPIH